MPMNGWWPDGVEHTVARGWLRGAVPHRHHDEVPFPYTHDQVIEAIASTRGDTAHFVLIDYLTMNEKAVGIDRFRRLIEVAHLRGQDAMSIRLSMARLDRTYAAQLPAILRSARSIESQQMLLANLPDFLPREPIASAADELEAWIRRRVERPTYLEFGAIWEVPSAVLGVLRTSSPSRARRLLTDLAPQLSPDEQQRARLGLERDDEDFETSLEQWRSLNGTEHRTLTDEELAESLIQQERKANNVMRRLGFRPAPA